MERWVRTLGTAGTGGPARLLLLHNGGSWYSHCSGAPDQPDASSSQVGRASCCPVPVAPPYWQSPLLLPLGSLLL